MQAEQAAIMKAAPRSATQTTFANYARKTAIGAASSVAIDTGASAMRGCWITLKPTVDCHIAFGDANVPDATTNDMVFFASQETDLWCPPGYTSFKVIADTVTGQLYHWRSDI